MAESGTTVVIDVVSQYKDGISTGMRASGKSADTLLNKVNKIINTIARLSGKSFNPKFGMEDRFSGKFERILHMATSFAGKTFSAVMTIKDKATSVAKSVLGKIKSELFSLKSLVASIGLFAFAKSAIQAEVQTQNMRSNFAVLLRKNTKGGTMAEGYKEADKRIDELTTFAGSTPFTRDEIYGASLVLERMTRGALSTGKGLQLVGDVAAGTGTDFSSVALTLGRLYEKMKNNQGIAEETARLQEIGAMSGETKKKLDDLSKSEGNFADKWKEVEKSMSDYNGLMEQQSDNLGNLLLGVKSFYTNNILKKFGSGLGKGITPLLQKFRQWRRENGDFIKKMGDGLEKVASVLSGKVANGVADVATKIEKLVNSDEFKNIDDIFGKAKFAWDKLIGEPLSDWWDKKKDGIKNKVTETLSDVFDTAKQFISDSLKDLLPGGEKAGIEDYIVGYLGLKALGKGKGLLGGLLGLFTGGGSGGGLPSLLGSNTATMNVSAGIVNVNGGLGGTGSGGLGLPNGGSSDGGLLTKLPGAGMLTSLAGKLGYTGTGSKAVIAGGAGLFGTLGTIAGVGNGLFSLGKSAIAAYNGDNKKSEKEAYRGGAKLSMVTAGAGIGTLVFPGLGTVVGGGIGGLASFAFGNKYGDFIRNRSKKDPYAGSYWKPDKKIMAYQKRERAKTLGRRGSRLDNDKSSKNHDKSVEMSTKANKTSSQQTQRATKSTKSFGSTTKSSASPVRTLGSNSGSAGSNVSSLGSSASSASASASSLSSALSGLAGAVSSAASSIRSAASSARAAAASASAKGRMPICASMSTN